MKQKTRNALDEILYEFGELSRAAKGFTVRLDDFVNQGGELTLERVKGWKSQIRFNLDSTIQYLYAHLDELEESMK